MANSSSRSGLGAGLLLVGLLACGGTLLYFAGKAFRKASPADAQSVSDFPPMHIAVAGSGVGDKSLQMFGCDLRTYPPPSVAAWIAFYQTGNDFIVHMRDDEGSEWPFFSALGRGHEICFIVQTGYARRPKRLTVYVADRQSGESKEFDMPPLPPAKRFKLPVQRSAIPGLELGTAQGSLSVAADLPADHLLFGRPLMSETLGPENDEPMRVVLAPGERFSFGKLGLRPGSYSTMPQSVAYQFSEVKRVSRHSVVEFGPYDLIEQFGERWIRRGQISRELAPGLRVWLQSLNQLPYRQPRRRQSELNLRLQPVFDVERAAIRRFELLDPKVVAGLPLVVKSGFDRKVPMDIRLRREENGPSLGKLNVRLSIDYDVYTPVRKGVVVYRWPGVTKPATAVPTASKRAVFTSAAGNR